MRFNPDGTVSRCGHMVNAPRFASLDKMESSSWLAETKKRLESGAWPRECQRCAEIEQEGKESIRLHAIKLHQTENLEHYLQVGGVLDNLCNAACLTCDARHSTRIGSLTRRDFPIVNNLDRFRSLPQDRIRHLDINGGEPSYSKNYRQILNDPPANLRTLRLNTNCTSVLTELHAIVTRGIDVTVTVSFDGVGPVHELVRWPIKWDDFYRNLMIYRNMPIRLNLWTTVSVLNVADLDNIQMFAREHDIDHDYAYLKHPAELSVENKNQDQINEYIARLKRMRGIT